VDRVKATMVAPMESHSRRSRQGEVYPAHPKKIADHAALKTSCTA
jgi:hypothetical protein